MQKRERSQKKNIRNLKKMCCCSLRLAHVLINRSTPFPSHVCVYVNVFVPSVWYGFSSQVISIIIIIIGLFTFILSCAGMCPKTYLTIYVMAIKAHLCVDIVTCELPLTPPFQNSPRAKVLRFSREQKKGEEK